MKKVRTVIERASDGSYGIYMDIEPKEMDYFITASGKSMEEAKEDFFKCYEEMREHYRETGRPFTEVEFCFEYDVVSYLEYYSSLFTLCGLSKITGIAKGQLSHYVTGKNKPNAKNEQKILEGLRAFGRDIAQLG